MYNKPNTAGNPSMVYNTILGGQRFVWGMKRHGSAVNDRLRTLTSTQFRSRPVIALVQDVAGNCILSDIGPYSELGFRGLRSLLFTLFSS